MSYWKHILKDTTYYLPNKGLLTRTAPRILFIILERRIGSFVPCYLHNNTCPWSVRCLPLTCRWMMEEKKLLKDCCSLLGSSRNIIYISLVNLFALEEKKCRLQSYFLSCIIVYFHFVWKWKSLSHVWFFATPWTVAHQAPLSMAFSRQEYWSR